MTTSADKDARRQDQRARELHRDRIDQNSAPPPEVERENVELDDWFWAALLDDVDARTLDEIEVDP